MTRASDLSERVRFQQRAVDENGDRLGAWEDGFSVAAGVTWLRGTEAVMADRLQGKQPVIITIRDGALPRTVTNAWRAVGASSRLLGRAFNILSVAPAKTPGFIDILADADSTDAG